MGGVCCNAELKADPEQLKSGAPLPPPAEPSEETQEEEVQPAYTAEDEAAEKAKIAKMGGSNAKKRGSVVGHSFSNQDKQNYVKPVHAKTDADKKTIIDILKKNEKLQVLFGHLTDAALLDVVMAFYNMDVARNVNVIQQGDEGDRFYIVSEGEFHIFVARRGEDGQLGASTKVLEVGPGAAFGELALMYNAPRAATVTCVVDRARVWALDSRDFQMLIMNAQEQKHRMYEGWLQEVPILKTLNHYELSQLSEMLVMDLFEAGEDVIKQGEEGDKFWILEEGECRAYISGDAGEKEVKIYNKPGDFFGEIALLSNQPRKATVRATADSQVHYILKEDFDAVIGPIKNILQKEAGQYPQYAEFLK